MKSGKLENIQENGNHISELRKSLIIENEFVKDIINTIPSYCYFDQDTKEQLTVSKHATTNKKIFRTGNKRNREIKDEVKNKFSKLDPEQNKKVTELISDIHSTNVLNGKESSKEFSNQANCTNTVESLQQKFKDKMDQIQKKKILGIPDAELDEAQLNKRVKRRLNRQRKKDRKKEIVKKPKFNKNLKMMEKDPKTVLSNSSDDVNAKDKSKPIFNQEGKMVFSKFDFVGDNKKKGKFSGKDYKGLLEKANKKKAKMDALIKEDHEKAKEVETKLAWKSALQKSEGIKVKDDPELLKKAIKKKEQKKRKSEKEWQKRDDSLNKMKDEKQTKRKQNIQKRISDKKNKNIQRAVKRGRMVPGFS